MQISDLTICKTFIKVFFNFGVEFNFRIACFIYIHYTILIFTAWVNGIFSTTVKNPRFKICREKAAVVGLKLETL